MYTDLFNYRRKRIINPMDKRRIEIQGFLMDKMKIEIQGVPMDKMKIEIEGVLTPNG